MTATKQRGGARAGAGRRRRAADQGGASAGAARRSRARAGHGKAIWRRRRFIDVESRSALRVPMMAWSAAAGFPSPAEDYVDRPLDFNELLIEHPAATFAIRIEGESMTGAGIFPGDIAVVDRARDAIDGNVILALLDGAFTVKRYRTRDGAVWLQAENPAFPDMPLSDGQSFEVWGVIKRCIRML